MTTFDEVRPIIEGRLYEWGRYVSESPSPATSSAYREDGAPQERGYFEGSHQESWTGRFWDAMRVSTVVERARDRLSQEQQALIELRYKHRQPWEKIAKALHVSRRTAYKVRDEALLIMAYELDLLRGPGEVKEEN